MHLSKKCTPGIQTEYTVSDPMKPQVLGMPARRFAFILMPAAMGAAAVGWWQLCIWQVLFGLIAIWADLYSISQETMRVLVGVGIVLESRRRCGAMVSTETRFVDINNIEAIIINEGLTTTNVYYYLALMIKQPKMHSGDEQGALVIPFKNLMPRLHILQEVYVEVHNLLLQREHDSAQR